MKHYFLPLFCLMLGGASLQAQTNKDLLQPKVQEFQLTENSETLALPESYKLVVAEGSCPHAIEAGRYYGGHENGICLNGASQSI